MARIPSYEEVRRFYNRFGSRQDLQFYENRALDELVEHSDFEGASSVLEFGCGTGRLAERLFKEKFSEDCRYIGLDLSPVMVELTKKRLAPWSQRVEVRVTEGRPLLAFQDCVFDRFISTYVVDILGPQDAGLLVSEAWRVLRPEGLISLVSLTQGRRGMARIMAWLWKCIYSVRPLWVGGCRPVRLTDYIDTRIWRMEHHKIITSFGLSSEVLVARKTVPSG